MILCFDMIIHRGVSSIIGPPIAGVVYELTLSYNISFYLAGSFLMVAALFSITADIVRRCSKSDEMELSEKVEVIQK